MTLGVIEWDHRHPKLLEVLNAEETDGGSNAGGEAAEEVSVLPILQDALS